MKSKKLFFASSYERKFKILLVVFIIFIAITGAFVASNYNYIVFKYFLSYNYVYTDTLDEIFIESLGEDNFKSYLSDFDNMVIDSVTKRIREKGSDRYTYLYTPQNYEKALIERKETAQAAEIREISEDTIYIYLPNMSTFTKDFIDENESTFSSYKNIIINLQGNLGGTLTDTYKIADLFLPKGDIIATENTRLSFTSKVVVAKDKKEYQYDQIVILIDQNSASASEVLAAALKENLDNVTLIGTNSYGKGIGQYTIELKGGYAVKATSMRLLTPEGHSIHTVGISPDIIYEDEDIVDFASEFILEQAIKED